MYVGKLFIFFGWSILHIVNSEKLNSLTCLKLKNKENVYKATNETYWWD